MQRVFFIILGILTVVIGTFFVSLEIVSQENTSPMTASVFFVPSTTPETLKQKFNNASTTGKKIKILIVPGHEPGFGGAEYKNLKERDMAVDLANELYAHLSKNPHYDIAFSRNKEGWNPDLATYFSTNWANIQSFIDTQKSEMARLVNTGKIVLAHNNIYHNDAPSDVATRLYGINKWANEQKADIILHIHFNDSASRKSENPDEYSGFSIYIPERQYSNALPSAAIAQNIFNRLARFSASSNLPYEDRGVVEEQELIAVGSNNSVDGASMLIEYGYIYESQFAHPVTRAKTIRELAFQTYLGLSDFFGEKVSATTPYQTTIIPYTWEQTLTKSKAPHPEVLATQTALTLEGLYPPKGKTKNDCPLNGVFGPCTQIALRNFQERFDIPGNGSIVGTQTRAKLNELYGK